MVVAYIFNDFNKQGFYLGFIYFTVLLFNYLFFHTGSSIHTGSNICIHTK